MEVNEQHRNGHAHRTPAELLANPSPSPSCTYQVMRIHAHHPIDSTCLRDTKAVESLFICIYRMGSSLRSLDIDEKTAYTSTPTQYDPSPFLLTDSHTK